MHNTHPRKYQKANQKFFIGRMSVKNFSRFFFRWSSLYFWLDRGNFGLGKNVTSFLFSQNLNSLTLTLMCLLPTIGPSWLFRWLGSKIINNQSIHSSSLVCGKQFSSCLLYGEARTKDSGSSSRLNPVRWILDNRLAFPVHGRVIVAFQSSTLCLQKILHIPKEFL